MASFCFFHQSNIPCNYFSFLVNQNKFYTMRKLIIFLSLTLFITGRLINAQSYFPPRGLWESKSPQSVGLDASKIAEAVAFAEANEYSGSEDSRVASLIGFGREPFHEMLGPMRRRGGPAGVILKGGHIVAQWGDVNRVDMTHSVTKSYLSTVAGLAVEDALITNVNDRVVNYVWDGSFDGTHNGKVTWEMLLQQSSAWSGQLFGLNDWADRPPRTGEVDDWKKAKSDEPGTVMEYNDVRVNLLAYSLLQVWRKPLPMILKERIMDPINASTTWRWYGYDHAWVNIDGIKMQSVTGGGHSGGGVFISAMDHARFGLLYLNEGNWDGQQLLSKDWVKAVQVSSAPNASYGYMWWLNRGNRKWEGVDDESIYYAAGFGGNFIVVDKANDMVVVTRWLEPNKIGEMMRIVTEAAK